MHISVQNRCEKITKYLIDNNADVNSNDNKKNTQLIINHISSLENRLNQKLDKMNINNNQLNNQVINYSKGDRYVGQIINGLREGKGIYYYNSGNRYEGDWRNGIKEG